jgi:hypothetical protein
MQQNIPWLDVDMDDAQRKEQGIYEELRKRPRGPLLDSTPPVYAEGYLQNADEKREAHWLKRIVNLRAEAVILMCGLLHMEPIARRLGRLGWTVSTEDLADTAWYKRAIGTCVIVERDGMRWSEFRPAGSNCDGDFN